MSFVSHSPATFPLRIRLKDRLDSVRKEMNHVGQDAPEVSGHSWKREAKRFGVKEPLDVP